MAKKPSGKPEAMPKIGGAGGKAASQNKPVGAPRGMSKGGGKGGMKGCK